MDYTIIILLLFLHYISDFLFQTRHIAETKSKSLKSLSIHCGLYSILFILTVGPIYGILNMVLHFIVDFTTSKFTTYFYQKEDMKMFWNIIGFDQLLHAIILITSYNFLYLQ